MVNVRKKREKRDRGEIKGEVEGHNGGKYDGFWGEENCGGFFEDFGGWGFAGGGGGGDGGDFGGDGCGDGGGDGGCGGD